MKLKELRIDSGKTQKEIADYLNVKQNTYSQYENGKITNEICPRAFRHAGIFRFRFQPFIYSVKI